MEPFKNFRFNRHPIERHTTEFRINVEEFGSQNYIYIKENQSFCC